MQRHMESLDAYIASQVNVTWFDTQPIRFNPEIGLPEFNIMKIEPAYCDGTYIYAIMDNSYKQGTLLTDKLTRAVSLDI